MAASTEFGEEYEKIWPLVDFNRTLSKYGFKLLKNCAKISKAEIDLDSDYCDLLTNALNFPIIFPIHTCCVSSQPLERTVAIKQQICTAYPVIHEKTLYLYLDFLEYKLKYGKSLEKRIYKHLSLTGFVQRLLAKRCVSFVGSDDDYLLLTAATGFGDKYLKVGTSEERDPLLFKNVLSYDEIKLSALMSVSSMSELINDGQRCNMGIPEADRSRIEPEALVIGIIGARFERKCVMEYQDIMITPNQNTKEMGYGPKDMIHHSEQYKCRSFRKFNDLEKMQNYRLIWNRFYDEPRDYLYGDVERDDQRYGGSFNKRCIFDNVVMKKRYAISFDMLLLEAQNRAKDAGKFAYLHVIGFGLGVWRAAYQQEKIFMDTFAQRIVHLLPRLSHIAVIHFSWFNINTVGPYADKSFIKSPTGQGMGGIEIFISKRNPNEKLKPPYDNMLLVVSYAWDGNALPGNEFWVGDLSSTNDPSTAASTLITELHNPHINSKYVCGTNLHIASEKYGVIHIGEYARKVLRM